MMARPGALISTVLSLIFALAFTAAPAVAANVGFVEVKTANGAEEPLAAAIWYPTDAPTAEHSLNTFTQFVAPLAPVVGRDLPLVAISHGGAGSLASHYGTALALAEAGFVAAAVSHAGDTYNDQSQVLKLWRRPEQLRAGRVGLQADQVGLICLPAAYRTH
jgi:predicted dienelactone hydrolase